MVDLDDDRGLSSRIRRDPRFPHDVHADGHVSARGHPRAHVADLLGARLASRLSASDGLADRDVVDQMLAAIKSLEPKPNTIKWSIRNNPYDFNPMTFEWSKS